MDMPYPEVGLPEVGPKGMLEPKLDVTPPWADTKLRKDWQGITTNERRERFIAAAFTHYLGDTRDPERACRYSIQAADMMLAMLRDGE